MSEFELAAELAPGFELYNCALCTGGCSRVWFLVLQYTTLQYEVSLIERFYERTTNTRDRDIICFDQVQPQKNGVALPPRSAG